MYQLIKLRDIELLIINSKKTSVCEYIEQDLSEKHFPLRSSCSKVGNVIQQINHCPADTFLSKSTALYPPDLLIGWHYLSFKQWGPETGNLALQSEGILKGKFHGLKVG